MFKNQYYRLMVYLLVFLAKCPDSLNIWIFSHDIGVTQSIIKMILLLIYSHSGHIETNTGLQFCCSLFAHVCTCLYLKVPQLIFRYYKHQQNLGSDNLVLFSRLLALFLLNAIISVSSVFRTILWKVILEITLPSFHIGYKLIFF